MDIEFPSDAEIAAMSQTEYEAILEKILDQRHERDYAAPTAKVIADYQGDSPEELAHLLQESVLHTSGLDIPYEHFLNEAVRALDDGTLNDRLHAHFDEIIDTYQGKAPEELALLFQEAAEKKFSVLLSYDFCLDEAVWALDDGTLYDKILEHFDEIGADYQGDNTEELALLFQESVVQKFSVRIDYDECLKEAVLDLETRGLSDEEFDELINRK